MDEASIKTKRAKCEEEGYWKQAAGFGDSTLLNLINQVAVSNEEVVCQDGTRRL